jgi:hypothetical protein
MPAGCGYSRTARYLLDACTNLYFVTMSILFSAWSSGKGINIVAFSALPMLRSEAAILQALNPGSDLSLQILKTHEPG